MRALLSGVRRVKSYRSTTQLLHSQRINAGRFMVHFFTQEMKDRESKRWLLEDFVNENDIGATELEMAYKRSRNLAPSAELNFDTWILVSGFGLDPAIKQRT